MPRFSRLLVTTAAATLMATAAYAGPHHGNGPGNGHGFGHHQNRYNNYRGNSGSRLIVSVGSGAYFGAPYRPYYAPRAYYRPTNVIYYNTPAPVAYYNPIRYVPQQAPVQVAANNDRYCREYQKNVVVGGRLQQGYGQACMQPDGNWQVID